MKTMKDIIACQLDGLKPANECYFVFWCGSRQDSNESRTSTSTKWKFFIFLANSQKRVYKVQKTWYNCNHNEQQCSMIFDNWQLMTVLLDILVSKTKRGEEPLAKLWALLVGLATKNRFLGQARQHAVSRACLRNKWETMLHILTARISLVHKRLKLVQLQHGSS